MSNLDKDAIRAALMGNWESAILLNQNILSATPNNSDAKNRLAYALSKTGEYTKAIELYEKILKHEKYNYIAEKNLTKLKQLLNNGNKATTDIPHSKRDNHHQTSPLDFIADAQKTKIVKLINPSSRMDLQCICIGEEVTTMKRGFELHVKSSDGVHLGTFPDDIGHTFIRLMQHPGRKIKIVIKDFQDNTVIVYVKY